MSIEGLVVDVVMPHIDEFHHVKNMDPKPLHILTTSENPTVVAMRQWMRTEALKTLYRAQARQEKMDEEFANEPYSKRSDIRRSAVIDPYFMTKAIQQGHAWGDKDFVGRVRRDNPKVFPKREAR